MGKIFTLVLLLQVFLALEGMTFAYAEEAAMFINPAGNVGIGTTDPQAKLDVNGTTRLGDSWFPDEEGRVFIRGKETIIQNQKDDVVKEVLRANDQGDVSVDTQLEVNGTTRLGNSWFPDKEGRVYITGKETVILGFKEGSPKEFFLVQEDGNVGIGTPAPKAKLDIVGSDDLKNYSLDVKGSVRLGRGTQESWFPYSDGNAYISGSNTFIRNLDWNGSKASETTFARFGKDSTPYIATISGNANIAGDLKVNRLVADGISLNGKNFKWENSLVAGGDFITSSDARLKADLHSLSVPLEKVRKLRGVSYRWNQRALDYFTSDIEKDFSAGPGATPEQNRKLWETERDKRLKELTNTNIGVIAQDVEAVLPEAVTTDEKGYKSVRYFYLIPLLIEALKEEDAAFAEQKQIVARQQAEMERLSAAEHATSVELVALKGELARLEAAVKAQPGGAARADSPPDPTLVPATLDRTLFGPAAR
jgi:hypothetical protein